MPQIVFADLRYDTIEDFESGSVNLVSWEDEDLNPNSWQLTSSGHPQRKRLVSSSLW